jgi:hypothetical protein
MWIYPDTAKLLKDYAHKFIADSKNPLLSELKVKIFHSICEVGDGGWRSFNKFAFEIPELSKTLIVEETVIVFNEQINGEDWQETEETVEIEILDTASV